MKKKPAAAAATAAPPQVLVRARLFSKTGRTAGLSFSITNERELVVGRTQGANLIVPDPLVSREHARFWFEEGHFRVENLSKTNGTFLNGAPIAEREMLEHLDVLGFGPNNDFIFALEPERGVPSTGLLPISRVRLLPTGAAGEPLEFGPGSVTVGRAEGNDVVLQEKAVSSQHARIAIGAEAVEVEDLGSANGTFLNERRVDRRLALQSGDTLLFAGVSGFVVQIERELEAAVPPGGYVFVGEEEAQLQLAVPPAPGHYVIGREASCALVLEHKKSVSRRHAELEVTADGRLVLRDLASGNGTFVNGTKIREAPLRVGDRLQIGLVALRVEART